MKIQKITYPDINNGLGCRISIWISGCSHKCPFCHNPQTWDKDSGVDFNINHKKIIYDQLSKSYIQGVTFTGGDPLSFYPKEVLYLAKELKYRFPNKDIWLYTGYTLAHLQMDINLYFKLCKYIDYIVDGPFKNELKDTTLAFRGSSNQIIYKNFNGEFKEINLDLDDDFSL